MPLHRIRETLGGLLPWSTRAEGGIAWPVRETMDEAAPRSYGLCDLDRKHPGDQAGGGPDAVPNDPGATYPGALPQEDEQGERDESRAGATSGVSDGNEAGGAPWGSATDPHEQLAALLRDAPTRAARKAAIQQTLSGPTAPATLPPALYRLLVARGYLPAPSAPAPGQVREAAGGAGHWVTIEDEDGIATHIFIGPHGLVTKGPAHLIGANIKHLPPGPKRTVTHHPEGHVPRDRGAHPDYTEHEPPQPKKGKPYARLHGAEQARQEQGPTPLSPEEAERGYQRAVERQRQARRQDSAPPSEEEPEASEAVDTRTVDQIMQQARRSDPDLLRWFSQVSHDYEAHVFAQVNRATATRLYRELDALRQERGFEVPPVTPLPAKSEDEKAQRVADRKLPFVRALPDAYKGWVRGLFRRAARQHIPLFGLDGAHLNDLADAINRPNKLPVSAQTTAETLTHFVSYKMQGHMEQAPVLDIKRVGPLAHDSSRTAHPERNYEESLAELPDAHRHFLAAIGTPFHIFGHDNPNANGELDPDTGAIALYAGANRFTAKHEAGHAVDRGLGVLSGAADPRAAVELPASAAKGGSVVRPGRQVMMEGWRSYAPDFMHLHAAHIGNWRLRPNMRSSPHEMFADAYAMAHDGDDQRRKLETYASALAAFMRDVDKEVALYVESDV